MKYRLKASLTLLGQTNLPVPLDPSWEILEGGLAEIEIFPVAIPGTHDGRLFDMSDVTPLLSSFAGPSKLPLNYNHEEDLAQGSKAGGWILSIYPRDGRLFSLVTLTSVDLRGQIERKEWRFSSAEFEGDNVNGVVRPTRLVGLALTNNPNIVGISEVRLLAKQKEKTSMNFDEFLAAVRKALNLPDDATPADMLVALGSLKGDEGGEPDTPETPPAADAMMAASDPKKCAPEPAAPDFTAQLAAHKVDIEKLASRLERLSSVSATADVEAFITGGRAEGKIDASNEPAFRQIFALSADQAKVLLSRAGVVTPPSGRVIPLAVAPLPSGNKYKNGQELINEATRLAGYYSLPVSTVIHQLKAEAGMEA